MTQEKMVEVKSKCKLCGKVDAFQIPASGHRARGKGKPLHLALPNLPAERAIQLTTHVCPACQKKQEESS
jgi:hypothetical protein